jgi:hypothetical protein
LISGQVAAAFGWPWVFYVFGIPRIIWILPWSLIYKTNPIKFSEEIRAEEQTEGSKHSKSNSVSTADSIFEEDNRADQGSLWETLLRMLN